MPDELDPDPIPISALQHAVYCLRQAALIHVERLWEENRFTAEGRVLHETVDAPGQRRARGVRRVTAMHVASRRLGIAGIVDVVEFVRDPEGETAFPIEHKRGKPKQHRADEIQLCAQALCLEEMTGLPVPEGALYYAQTRRREAIAFDMELRVATEAVVSELRGIFASRTTPPAEYEARKCNACSLIDECRPKAGVKSARIWRDRAIAALLSDAPAA